MFFKNDIKEVQLLCTCNAQVLEIFIEGHFNHEKHSLHSKLPLEMFIFYSMSFMPFFAGFEKLS